MITCWGGLRARRLRPPLRVLSLTLVAVVAAIGTTVVTPTTVSASVDVHAADSGTPSWWNGDCNANTWNAIASSMGWTGAGAHRLGASYLGVPVCGPRPGADGAPNVAWARPGWGELEWQCPELAFRFMAQFYGVSAYGANGGDVVRNYTTAAGGQLVKIDNGTVGMPPLPGDVISFDNAGAAGHVGVVASSVVDELGNGSITMLSQNDTADGWRTLAVTGWHVQSFGSYVPYGWLHDPLGRAGPAAPTPPSSGGFHPLAPVRILDSRDGTGGSSSAWGPWSTRTVAVAGAGGVPAGAKAVVLNVTVTDTTAPSYLTVWPTGQPQPTASNLNWPAGDTRPNLVVAKIGAGGTISIFNLLGTTNVIADVQGWFDDGSDPAADTLVAVSPTRVLDSRDGTGGYSTPWGAHAQRDLAIAGVATVPADADAVLLNVTVTDTSAPSYLTVWPGGEPQPTASNLNWPAGDTRPNLVVAKIGAGGTVSIFNHEGSAQVVADVVGYFRAPLAAEHFTAIAPRGSSTRATAREAGPRPGARGPFAALSVAGIAGVPPDAKAVMVNVTITNPTAASYLTAWPSGQALPLASNLNFAAGSTVPNLAFVPLGSDGRIAIFNLLGSVDVIVDVVGYTR